MLECRNLLQQAQDVLVRQRALSADDALRYVYEIAQARKLPLAEASSRIVAGEWAGAMTTGVAGGDRIGRRQPVNG